MGKAKPGSTRDSAGAPGEVTEVRSTRGIKGGTITMQRELVYPGKGARVYEYWYAYQRVGHRLFKAYVGSAYDEAKARKRLAAKMRSYDPC